MIVSRCPNCGVRPLFVLSDDKRYESKLLHSTPTCTMRLVVYHHTPRKAAAKMALLMADRWIAKNS